MKRYTFNNFTVDDRNRPAFDVMRRIADLGPVAPLPLMIIGDEGSGKTHLLYAVVNRLRASSPDTGLAYVTAHDFPDQVRALVDDPSPVERAKTAVLLVDQLDSVDEIDPGNGLMEELEAVVRIFMDNGHYVAMASNVHPGRLKNVPDGLRALIERGQTIELEPPQSDGGAHAIEDRIRQESEGLIKRQQEEIQELQQELEAARQAAAPPEPSTQSQQREQEDIVQRLNVAKAYGESLERDLATTREELAQVRRDQHDAAAASAATAEEEANALDVEKQAALEEATQVHQELEKAREAVRAAVALESELGDLRDKLVTAETGHAQAREEANELLQRAEGLLEVVEANRAQFTQVEAEQRKQIENLESLLAKQRAESVPPEDLEEAKSQALAALSELDDLRAAHEELQRTVDTRLAEAQAETQGVRDAHDRTTTERDQIAESKAALQEENVGLRSELEAAQAHHDDLTTRLESHDQAYEDLQKEAAAQVAEAHGQAGELEGQLSRAQETLRSVSATTLSVVDELTDFAGEMRTGADELVSAAQRICGTLPAIEEPAIEEPAEPAEDATQPDPQNAASFPAIVPEPTDEANDVAAEPAAIAEFASANTAEEETPAEAPREGSPPAEEVVTHTFEPVEILPGNGNLEFAKASEDGATASDRQGDEQEGDHKASEIEADFGPLSDSDFDAPVVGADPGLSSFDDDEDASI
jgi:hypothetical protein